jgi:hypothetical protein
MSFFQEMGFIAYPLAIVSVFLVIEIARATDAVLADRGASASATSARIHPVLLWGVLAAVLGVLGTVIGVYQAAEAISRAGTATPTLVWSGIKVTLGSTIVGMLLLGIASVGWLGLQFVNGRRTRAAS